MNWAYSTYVERKTGALFCHICFIRKLWIGRLKSFHKDSTSHQVLCPLLSSLLLLIFNQLKMLYCGFICFHLKIISIHALIYVWFNDFDSSYLPIPFFHHFSLSDSSQLINVLRESNVCLKWLLLHTAQLNPSVNNHKRTRCNVVRWLDWWIDR